MRPIVSDSMTLIRSLSHRSQLLWRKDTCRSWWKLQVPGPHSRAFCVHLWLSPRSLCFSKHSGDSDEGLRQVARGTKSFVWVGVKKDLCSWFLISEVLNDVKIVTSFHGPRKNKNYYLQSHLKPVFFFLFFFFFFSKRKEGRVRERECEWRSVFIRCYVDLLCLSLPQTCPLSTHGCQSLLSPDQPGGGFAEIFRMTHWHPPPASLCWQRGILLITRVSVLVS